MIHGCRAKTGLEIFDGDLPNSWMDIIIFIQCGKSTLNGCDQINSMWTFQRMPFDEELPHSFNFFVRKPSFVRSEIKV